MGGVARCRNGGEQRCCQEGFVVDDKGGRRRQDCLEMGTREDEIIVESTLVVLVPGSDAVQCPGPVGDHLPLLQPEKTSKESYRWNYQHQN